MLVHACLLRRCFVEHMSLIYAQPTSKAGNNLKGKGTGFFSSLKLEFDVSVYR